MWRRARDGRVQANWDGVYMAGGTAESADEGVAAAETVAAAAAAAAAAVVATCDGVAMGDAYRCEEGGVCAVMQEGDGGGGGGDTVLGRRERGRGRGGGIGGEDSGSMCTGGRRGDLVEAGRLRQAGDRGARVARARASV